MWKHIKSIIKPKTKVSKNIHQVSLLLTVCVIVLIVFVVSSSSPENSPSGKLTDSSKTTSSSISKESNKPSERKSTVYESSEPSEPTSTVLSFYGDPVLFAGDFMYAVNTVDSFVVSFHKTVDIIKPNTVTIIKYTGGAGDVDIPTEIDGMIVSCIAEGAFQDRNDITSVKIPNGVLAILANAFASCTGLTSIIIPEKVRLLDNCAFAGCDNLSSVYFEGDAPLRGNYVFAVTYEGDPNFAIYYRKEKSGWEEAWGDIPKKTW